MKSLLSASLMTLAVLASTGLAAEPEPMPGVRSPAQARVDYMLKCQGCHLVDGAGAGAGNPPLTGEVARFLSVNAGREYLVRVPGVATVDLDDARLAQLLNWTLHRFDPDGIPQDFKPYTAREVRLLRSKPLRSEAPAVRAALMARSNS